MSADMLSASVPPPSRTVDADHPWLGLLSFTEETQRFFFGRDEEIREIFVRVREQPLTVLFGQSGLGKTSLLGAGLLPKLRVERFRPVLVRFCFDAGSPSLVEQVRYKLAEACAEEGLLERWKDAGSLWEVVHRTNLAVCEGGAPVLVFDQFEEIFTLGQAGAKLAEREELQRQLADLIENRPPLKLQERLQGERALAGEFDFAASPLRVVITLREDFLSHLEAWNKVLPSLMRNRMALHRLSGPQALEAVVHPGRLEGRNLVSDEVGARIVRLVAKRAPGTPLEEIEAVPPLLSLVCDELNHASPNGVISAEQVEQQSGEVLQHFYDCCFEGFPPALRHYVEDRMVTVGGHRNSVALEDAESELRRAGVAEPAKALDALITRRLLSAEERGGLLRLEITHDVLTDVVVRSRTERQERERAEKAEQEKATAEAREAAVRRERTKLRRVAIAMAALAVFALGGLGVAWWGYSKAEAETRKAEEQTRKAEAEKNKAELAEMQAKVARFQSEQEKRSAAKAWSDALRAKADVEKKNTELKDRLREAATSDRRTAQNLISQGRKRDALAHLARSLDYEPDSILAGEMAIYALNDFNAPMPLAICQGHEGGVTSAQFSPDGKFIVTASTDKTAKVWDAASGSGKLTLQGHGDSVVGAQYSPDGKYILTASADKTAKVWDAASGKLVATLTGHEGAVQMAEFSPDGRRILTASQDRTARVWEAPEGKLLLTLKEHTSGVVSAHFSPDGSRIATASSDRTARVWDAQDGKPVSTLSAHAFGLTGAQFSADGSRVVTCSQDKQSLVWEAQSGRLMAILTGHGGAVNCAAFVPDGTRILTCARDSYVIGWDAENGALQTSFFGHRGDVIQLCVSPDGTRAVSASDDQTAILWEARTGQMLARLEGHEARVTSVQFSPDGRRIVTGSSDRTARVWEAQTGRLVATFQELYGSEVNSVRFSPDGTRIVMGLSSNSSRVRDAESGESLVSLLGHTGGVTYAQYSPDGVHVVTSSNDKSARIWDAATGMLLEKLEGHTDRLSSARYSPDGKLILTASHDGTARVWEADSGKVVSEMKGHEFQVWGAQFSPDGERIATASADTTARVWETRTGQPVVTMRGHDYEVWTAQFSPDGKRLLTASQDKTARLWDASSGQQLSALQGHELRVNAAQFSADGDRIVTASQDNSARVWDAQSGALLGVLMGHQNQVLDAQFNADRTRLATCSSDASVRLWECPPSSAPPAWFGSFLRCVSQRNIRTSGDPGNLQPAEWLELRAKVAQSVKEDGSRWGTIARWLMTPVSERAIRPGAATSGRLIADKTITPYVLNLDIQRAYEMDPDHPLVHLAMSAFESKPAAVEFLRERSLKRLGDDTPVAILVRAAAFLQFQVGQEKRGVALLDNVLKREPGNITAHFTRAYLLQSAGTVDETMQAYSDGLKLEPPNGARLAGAAFYAAQNNRLAEGRAWLDQALKMAEANTYVQYMAAWVCGNEGQWPKMLEHAVLAGKLLWNNAPGSSDVPYSWWQAELAIAQWKCGTQDAAIQTYRDLIRLYPNWAKAETVAQLGTTQLWKDLAEQVRAATLIKHPEMVSPVGK